MQCLATLTGHKLVEFPVNSETDALDLIGGYEQVSDVMFRFPRSDKGFLVFLLNRSISTVAIATSWVGLLMF